MRLGRPRNRASRRALRWAAAVGVAIGSVGLAGPDGTGTVEATGDSSDIIAIVIEGTGFGHGRGLSQWGAYGYAVDHGWTSDQILDHYYGGTDAGTTAGDQRIRVRLTGYDGLGTVGVVSYGAGVRWGSETAPAMRAVEIDRGVFRIERASAVGCPSAGSLSVPGGTVLRGARGGDVEQIQRFLDRFQPGADSIVIDGIYGGQTAGFLAAWQSAQGLPVDGDRWDADDAARARDIIAAAGGDVAWTAIGTHTQTTGSPVRFTTAGGDAQATGRNEVLGVCNSAGRVTHYRGAIEVVDAANGNRVVNDVPVEQYLRGVVPKEISANWAFAGDGRGVHAVRAQSVAARSYGLSENRGGDSYEYRNSDQQFATTCDTTSCQVYAGAATRSSASGSPTRVEQDASDAAIVATATRVRRWPDGRMVRTEFSASNGPRTAGGAFPVVDDIGDDTSPNPNHRWTRVLDADTFAEQHGLGRITSVGMAEPSSEVYRQFAGIWFDDVVIAGTQGTFRQQAWDFRGAYGLRSPGFRIRPITRSNTNFDMAFIGDSVGNSIAGSDDSELRRLTDGTFASQRIDVVDGRCTTKSACPGSTGVEVASNLPTGLDLVVVELGYNDTVSQFAADIDAMMTALDSRGVQQVAWINMADIRRSGGSSVYGPANAALRTASQRWPNLTVLDWDTASDTAERVRWFSDGVHLTATGQAEFAIWTRDQLIDLAPSHYLVPPKRIELPVVGRTLVGPDDGSNLTVPNDVAAVAVTVTVVSPVADGFIAVWPCEDDLPEISSLNYFGGDVRANSVIAPVSPDGTICLFSLAGTDLVVDVAGWFSGGSDPGFVGLRPQRRVDSRDGTGGVSTRVERAAPIRIPVHGTAATTVEGVDITIPDDAAAVALNVAAVMPDAPGFLQLWPCGTERPEASNVNYFGGQIVSNGVIAPIGPDGDVCLFALSPTDVIVDLMGFIPGDGAGGEVESTFRRAIPTRLIDTRLSDERLAPGGTLEVPVTGRQLLDPAGSDAGLTVPNDATAVAVNITLVDTGGPGFGTLWPCTAPMPNASNINHLRAGEIVANSAIAPIGPDGSICVFSLAAADVIVDVAGWFVGGGFVPAIPERLVDTRYAVGPIPV
ncbi:MAG: SpoIID/LytB domain-containing protein [Actinomycetota bacterium]